MIRSQKELFDVAVSLTAAARTTSANGSAVDLQGYGAATFVVLPVTWTDGTHAFTFEESDASGSGFAAIAAASLDGALPSVTSAPTAIPYRVGYMGIKRYVRAVQTVTGSPSTGLIAGVHVNRGEPKKAPK